MVYFGDSREAWPYIVAHALLTGFRELRSTYSEPLKIWKKTRLRIGCWRPTRRCIKHQTPFGTCITLVRNNVASSIANRTLSHFGRLVLPLTLCWIRPLNLLWRQAQLEGPVRRQPQHQQSQQHQAEVSVQFIHDFLSQLEERKSWWDAVARNAFVSETGRGHKLEFSSWLPLSLPVRPLPQRLRKEKRQTLYSLKGQWNQWGTSTEASTPICSWTRNRSGVQTCHQLKGPELV